MVVRQKRKREKISEWVIEGDSTPDRKTESEVGWVFQG
jgi:hypothetical protein